MSHTGRYGQAASTLLHASRRRRQKRAVQFALRVVTDLNGKEKEKVVVFVCVQLLCVRSRIALHSKSLVQPLDSVNKRRVFLFSSTVRFPHSFFIWFPLSFLFYVVTPKIPSIVVGSRRPRNNVLATKLSKSNPRTVTTIQVDPSAISASYFVSRYRCPTYHTLR